MGLLKDKKKIWPQEAVGGRTFFFRIYFFPKKKGGGGNVFLFYFFPYFCFPQKRERVLLIKKNGALFHLTPLFKFGKKIRVPLVFSLGGAGVETSLGKNHNFFFFPQGGVWFGLKKRGGRGGGESFQKPLNPILI